MIDCDTLGRKKGKKGGKKKAAAAAAAAAADEGEDEDEDGGDGEGEEEDEEDEEGSKLGATAGSKSPKVRGWGVYCCAFLLLPVASSVSCSCLDALNTLRVTNFHCLPPSPAVSQCLQPV